MSRPCRPLQEPRYKSVASGLFDLDQRAGKILRMQKQDRLAMRADPRLAVAQHPRAFPDQRIARGDDVGNLIADVVNPAVGVAFEEFGNWRCFAKRLDE